MEFLALFGSIVTIFSLLLSLPFIGSMINFFLGWLTGLIVLWILGPHAPDVFEVFSPKLTVELVPMVFGVIACIGDFFKSNTTVSK